MTEVVAAAAAPAADPAAAAATTSAALVVKPNQYHCDYCRVDISSVVRISCVECINYDFCLSCFSKGIAVGTHHPWHAYRIVEQIKLPLLEPAWGADEELLLLDAIETCGFGNWADIAEQLGSKSKQQCEYHYNQMYLNAVTAPLPDPEKLLVKQKQQQKEGDTANATMTDAASTESTTIATAAATVDDGVKPDDTSEKVSGEEPVKMEIDEVKSEMEHGLMKQDEQTTLSFAATAAPIDPATQQPPTASSPVPVTVGPAGRKSKSKGGRQSKAGTAPSAAAATTNTSTIVIGGHTPLTSWRPAPAKPVSGLAHLVGYIPARNDFDTEFDQDAELMLADMEFLPTDTPWERELKLKVLSIYNSKLDARAERKKFIIERGFLERKDKKRARDEKDIANNVRCFARFHSQAQHEEFIAGLTREARLRKKIEKLQQARLNGCKTLAEAERFEELKNKQFLNNQSSASANGQPTTAVKGSVSSSMIAGSSLRPSGSNALSAQPPFAIDMCKDVELLSEREKALCVSLHLLPHHYMQLKHRLLREAATRGWLKEGQPRSLIQINVNKAKQLVDFFVQAGWTNTHNIIAATSQAQGQAVMEIAQSSNGQ